MIRSGLRIIKDDPLTGGRARHGHPGLSALPRSRRRHPVARRTSTTCRSRSPPSAGSPRLRRGSGSSSCSCATSGGPRPWPASTSLARRSAGREARPRDVDRGMPRDLRLNPQVGDRGSGGHGRLGRLLRPASRRRLLRRARDARHAAARSVCSTDADGGGRGMSVTVPFTDPVRDDSPVTVSGRVSRAGAASVELVYPERGTGSVAIGDAGFYVAEVPAGHLRAVHGHGSCWSRATPARRARPGGDPGRRDHAAFGGGAPARPDRARHGEHRIRPHAGAARARRPLRAGVDHLTLRYPDGRTVRIEPTATASTTRSRRRVRTT